MLSVGVSVSVFIHETSIFKNIFSFTYPHPPPSSYLFSLSTANKKKVLKSMQLLEHLYLVESGAVWKWQHLRAHFHSTSWLFIPDPAQRLAWRQVTFPTNYDSLTSCCCYVSFIVSLPSERSFSLCDAMAHSAESPGQRLLTARHLFMEVVELAARRILTPIAEQNNGRALRPSARVPFMAVQKENSFV